MLSNTLGFLKNLIATKSFTAARHLTFHPHLETWSMLQFNDGRDPFYRSKHRVCCPKCQFQKTTYRLWPKFDADRNQGYQLAEAHHAARNNSFPELS